MVEHIAYWVHKFHRFVPLHAVLIHQLQKLVIDLCYLDDIFRVEALKEWSKYVMQVDQLILCFDVSCELFLHVADNLRCLTDVKMVEYRMGQSEIHHEPRF